MSHTDSDTALAHLHAERPATREHQWRGQELPPGWLFTFAPGCTVPFGAPSWIVLDDGRVGSVETHESFDEAFARLRAQPAPAP